jgi:hypothetical protein
MIIPVPRRRQYFDVKRWREDGFPSIEDAESWGHRACGLACVAMLIELYTCERPTLSDLLWEGLRRVAYCPQGWLHAGLAGLLDQRGVASAPMPLSYPDVLAVVLGGTPVIASVSDEFPMDGRRGGHLVVVTGVAVESGKVSTVFFNDPSEWGDSHNRVPGDRFAASFSGRVVVPGTPAPSRNPTVSDPRARVATLRDI